MKTKTTKPTKIDPLPVVRKLLRLQREQDIWLLSRHHPMLDLALDILGVPPDTDAFSRDVHYELYHLMGNDICGYIDIVTGKYEHPEPRYMPSAAAQRARRCALLNTVHERRSSLTFVNAPQQLCRRPAYE
jgi:hypothetical protein